MKVPSATPNWTAVLSPLQSEVWLALAVTFVISWMFLYWYCKWYFNSSIQGHSIPATDALLWMAAIALEETVAVTHQLKSMGIRIFFILFLLAAYTLTLAYKGTLTSEMTVSFPPTPIDTIR